MNNATEDGILKANWFAARLWPAWSTGREGPPAPASIAQPASISRWNCLPIRASEAIRRPAAFGGNNPAGENHLSDGPALLAGNCASHRIEASRGCDQEETVHPHLAGTGSIALLWGSIKPRLHPACSQNARLPAQREMAAARSTGSALNPRICPGGSSAGLPKRSYQIFGIEQGRVGLTDRTLPDSCANVWSCWESRES
jgi:hypothetical protein